MARKSKILPKKKHYTKTKAEKDREKQVVKIALGNEPSDEELADVTQYSANLQWYNVCCDVKEHRAFLEGFLEEANNTHLDAIRRVPDVWLNLTACRIARMMSRGANLPETAVPFFKEKLAEMIKRADDAPTDDDTPPSGGNRTTIQQNIRNKASDLVGELEGLIDDGVAINGWSAYKYLSENQVSSVVASKIIDRFQPILDELFQVQKKTDADLIEGYKHLSNKQLKLMIEFYQALIEDTEKFARVNKKVKAPRKARPITAEKKLKLFKYSKENLTYKVKSINPEKILGATELWTFNTSNRILTVYRASNGDTLNVHRTAIVNFDPKASMSKRIGRNTEDIIKTAVTGGKRVLNGLMESISSGPAPFSDRVHDKIILLRAM